MTANSHRLPTLMQTLASKLSMNERYILLFHDSGYVDCNRKIIETRQYIEEG
jgi:hypothetical protein